MTCSMSAVRTLSYQPVTSRQITPRRSPSSASEPNLKVKNKLKKHLNTRKSPLTRKESAPPTVKHRAPDTLGKLTRSG